MNDLPIVIMLASVTETYENGVTLPENFAEQVKAKSVEHFDEKDVSAGERISTLELVNVLAGLVQTQDDRDMAKGFKRRTKFDLIEIIKPLEGPVTVSKRPHV